MLVPMSSFAQCFLVPLVHRPRYSPRGGRVNEPAPSAYPLKQQVSPRIDYAVNLQQPTAELLPAPASNKLHSVSFRRAWVQHAPLAPRARGDEFQRLCQLWAGTREGGSQTKRCFLTPQCGLVVDELSDVDPFQLRIRVASSPAREHGFAEGANVEQPLSPGLGRALAKGGSFVNYY